MLTTGSVITSHVIGQRNRSGGFRFSSTSDSSVVVADVIWRMALTEIYNPQLKVDDVRRKMLDCERPSPLPKNNYPHSLLMIDVVTVVFSLLANFLSSLRTVSGFFFGGGWVLSCYFYLCRRDFQNHRKKMKLGWTLSRVVVTSKIGVSKTQRRNRQYIGTRDLTDTRYLYSGTYLLCSSCDK